MQSEINRAKLHQLFSQYATNKKGSVDCCVLIYQFLGHNSKVNLFCLLHAQYIGKSVLLYVFKMVFTTFLFRLLDNGQRIGN